MSKSAVLGLNFAHDAAAAIVKDGRLVAAVSRERISRVKKDGAVTRELIDYVLDVAGVKLDEIAAVASSDYVTRYNATTQYPELFVPGEAGQPDAVLRNNLVVSGSEPHYLMRCRLAQDRAKPKPFNGSGFFRSALGDVDLPHVLVGHHLAHASAAFFTSPFEQAACLSADSNGHDPQRCSIFALGEGNLIKPLRCPGIMIGNAYGWFCEWLGLGPTLYKAGTLMGLASFSTPSPLARQKALEYGRSWFDREIPDDIEWCRWMWSELAGRGPDHRFTKAESDSKEAQGIAASIQHVFEEVMVDYATRLDAETEGRNGGNLCLSGGSFLNCDANSAIQERAPFSAQHLFPGCSDDGIAVGAALYAAHTAMGLPRAAYEPLEIAYLGQRYEAPADFGRPLDIEVVARLLADGKVVAWFRGRSEFGPRALGNRSLLADPRNPNMRDHINANVKKREWFRPFAPIIAEEDAGEWFDLAGPSPYMLRLARVLKPELIPAVTHVDGTARVQTLRKQDNPEIHALLRAFERFSGVPMLLNTSLNGHEEPLCETPQDALRFFANAPIDLLVIEDRMQLKA